MNNRRRPIKSGLLTGCIVASALILAPPAATQPPPRQAGTGPFGNAAEPAWPRQPTAPAGAPNVLVILTDDQGFASSETFGGVIPTPAFARLAREGLAYNNFHTTAMCSPTRAALLTGRNHHNVGMGRLSDQPAMYEGYTSAIPDSTATIADVLKHNGYSTAMFGKAHFTPSWELTEVGPFERWPTGLGFEYFYGFLQGDTNQWTPTLVENTRYVQPPGDDPSYLLDRDLADRAIQWMNQQRSIAPQKPFLIYYATGSTHSPHHAPEQWLARFRGKFDHGWDRLREEIFARQKAGRIIPADTLLPPRPAELPAWNNLSAAEKRVCARLMEAYAAQLAFLDAQIGRILDALDSSGQAENTLVVLIQGDNGASAEGGLYGNFYEQYLNFGLAEDVKHDLAHLDEIGGPLASNNYAAGWAWAMNTPFKGFKQHASHFGGTRNGLILRWPRGIAKRGGMRQQFSHVIDIAPTIFDAARVKPPAILDGIPQKPLDGVSLAYSFATPNAPSRRNTQYFELLQNIAIYRDGWVAATTPAYMPWNLFQRRKDVPFEARQWELYNVARDFSQARNLAATESAKLREMQALFRAEAARNHVFPLHNPAAASAGRPRFEPREVYTYTGDVRTIHLEAAPQLGSQSYEITADVTVSDREADGVMVAHGGRFSGYSFYLKDGRPTFSYNAVPPRMAMISAPHSLEPGRHIVAARFTPSGAPPSEEGELTISVDGREVARGKIAHTLPRIWFTEGLDIGRDLLTPVSGDYVSPAPFPGLVHKLEIRPGPNTFPK